jgi:CspA family cold shock protein
MIRRVNAYRWRHPFDQQQWMSDVLHGGEVADESLAEILRHVNEECRGAVKFYRGDKGWGGIESDETPADVWVHFSVIEDEGFRSLEAGDQVVFRWEPALQDSWRCRAVSVRKIERRD